MSENKGKPRDEEQLAPNDINQSKPKNDNKKSFGGLKPLTAIQIISLIVPSSPVGASACY